MGERTIQPRLPQALARPSFFVVLVTLIQSLPVASAAGLAGTLLTLAVPLTCRGADRPNFLWILSEDSSKHYFRLFDERGAETPHIEQLANQGLIFDHAFSCSPVCSVARTTLITGVYAPRLGTQFHRHIQLAHLPEGLQMFPAYLREVGYYTTNNSKKDYNAVEGPSVWDESSQQATWRSRPANTPFFHMQTFTMSHESSLHFSRGQMQSDRLDSDPADMQLAPYHPDTQLFRYTQARYHDRIGQMDTAVGELVERLAADGLLEDTFIFYFGDHGGVLPRSKGYLYETGLHVPLVVRIPANWQHLVTLPRGSRVGGFVSFVDFGPTVLELAGASLPDVLDGTPFLGRDISAEQLNAGDTAFGYADRFDEKCDMVRSLRQGRFKYIRNYQPFYPDALQNNYRYQMLAYQQWRQLHDADQLTSVQIQFFQPKPAEALYDLNNDPHEVANLASDPRYSDTLAQMRQLLEQQLKVLPDLSFYPENVLIDEALQDPIAFGQAQAEQIGQLIDIANLMVLPFDEAQQPLREALEADDPWHRYWALIVCSAFGSRAAPLTDIARLRLEDEEPLVRVRAAEFLALIKAEDPRPVLLDVLRESSSPVVNLLTLNTVVFVQDHLDGYELKLNAEQVRARSGEVDRRLQYLNR